MSDEHDEMLARVRVSDRLWCESDLYWRTNRWAEDGRSQDVSDSFRMVRMADTVITLKQGEINVIAVGGGGRNTYQRTGR